MYKCPKCGADIEFNPKSQKVECSYCGGKFEPKQFEEKKNLAAEEEKVQNNEEVFDAIMYKCKQCGAQILATEETGATFCSYCGSSAILEKQMCKQKKPTYVIPFEKTKEECEKTYRNALKKFWFAPKNMAEDEQIEKFRGIYMPYWVYSLEKKGPMIVSGSREYRRGDYIYKEKYNIESNVNAEYNGISFDASSNFYDELSENIAPFDIKESKDFSDAYLSGFYADVGDVDSKIYNNNAQEVVTKDMISKLKKDYAYTKYHAKFITNNMIDVKTSEIGFFPVWFLASKNKKGDRISYAVVNGQTGKIAAEIPIDIKKYIIASLVLALPIFILLNIIFSFTPTKVNIFTILASIICLLIANCQTYKLNKRELRTEDQGYIFKNKGVSIKKWNIKDKRKILIYPRIALIITIFTMILNPVDDIYYYVVGMISSCLIFKTFWDIIKLHNLLNTRKIPQLEKRGGDE